VSPARTRSIVLKVDVQDALEVATVDDQQPVEHSARAVLTNRSAMAFACGARTGVLTTRMPALRKLVERAGVLAVAVDGRAEQDRALFAHHAEALGG
jgi:hypothetical protein